MTPPPAPAPPVAPAEDDVAGLLGDVRAGADRHADVGLGEGGGVVDPIADHRHGLALRLELAHLRRLVLRRNLRQYAIDAELSADGVRRATGGAGEHRP